MFQVTRKLNAIKKELRCWSRQVFDNYRSNIEANNAKLQYVQNKLLENPNSNRLNS